MLNTYLSPAGRMNPNDFKNSALTLIVIGVIFSIPELLGMDSLGALAGIVSIALLYPWIVIWIKRYHDGGKSGWSSLLPIIVYLLATIILMMTMLGDGFMAIIEASSTGASQADTEKMAEEMVAGKEIMILLANTALSAVVALGFNQYLISNDDHENQYGPVT
jgi:uncharacterized membrane protein YhaH (DUF805 family)